MANRRRLGGAPRSFKAPQFVPHWRGYGRISPADEAHREMKSELRPRSPMRTQLTTMPLLTLAAIPSCCGLFSTFYEDTSAGYSSSAEEGIIVAGAGRAERLRK